MDVMTAREDERAAEAGLTVIVLGAGYVGLVTAACLAELGHRVTCVDKDQRKQAALAAGACPIYEPGLDALIARGQASGRLKFAAEAQKLDQADAVVMAVGTPPLATGGADLSQLFGAVGEIAPRLGRRTAILIKSTVPPGTADAVQRLVERIRPELKPTVISNPEFLREGAAIDDFMAPDRIVAGCATPYARWLVGQLYEPLTARGARLLITSRRSAELVKYGANAFLATKISFINEIADLCEAIGADVADVACGIGLDRRIGGEFLQPGPGYGGSCFPKDTLALLATAAEHQTRLRTVSGAVVANARRTRRLAERVARALGGELRGRRVAVLGLAFKPGTDDVRESPAIALVRRLVAAGAEVSACDPRASLGNEAGLENVRVVADAYACAAQADAVVLATHWADFAELDFERLAAVCAQKVFVDLRNGAPAEALVRAGFVVHAVGRALRAPEHAASALVDDPPELRCDPPISAALAPLDCAAP